MDARFRDNVLIGMGAIVMDDCLVESNSIVGAGSVVTQGTHIKTGEVWGGVPARENQGYFRGTSGRRGEQDCE